MLAFLGTECPLANIYAPRLAELARGYEKKGVAFFGVDSNEQDAPSRAGTVCQGPRLAVSVLEGRGKRAGRQAECRAHTRRSSCSIRIEWCGIAGGSTTSSAWEFTARHQRGTT